jgi:hypothetical protein
VISLAGQQHLLFHALIKRKGCMGMEMNRNPHYHEDNVDFYGGAEEDRTLYLLNAIGG